MKTRRALILILCSVSSKREAQLLARKLVQEHLVACAHISERGESMYYWNKRLERSQEYILFLKTAKQMFARVQKRIQELHTYENPEIISFRADECNDAYAAWVCDQCDVRMKQKKK